MDAVSAGCGNMKTTGTILSRGQLVKHGHYKSRGQVLISLIVPITKEMLPSFRIIAYYHQTDTEVVSDSVWVDVKDSCIGPPEGVLVKSPKGITLEPTNKGAGGVQKEIMNSGIPKTDMFPNTPTRTQISVKGRENVGVLVENAISGKSMGTLIYQPSGCGMQNMIHMTLPVIATRYLDKTNQWEIVGFQKRNEAFQHIKTGLSFFHNKNTIRKISFKQGAQFNRTSITIIQRMGFGRVNDSQLTAYVAKVFTMANNLETLQKDVICGAVKFLILNAQHPDGVFREVGSGDVRGTDSEASMMAFCHIAMQESRTLCTATVNSLPGSIDKAVAYLGKQLPSLTNPYVVAMTSYALANEGNLDREILFKFVSPDGVAVLGSVYREGELLSAVPHVCGAHPRYKDRDRDATMWILDIGLLTGFTVNTNDLDLVSQTRPEEITFRIHQKLKVGVLQPAAVSVYEYYDQTQCVKFYHPVRTAGQLLRLCRNKICTCAAGKQDGVSVKMHLKFLKELNCSMQKKGNISNDQRTTKFCETTPSSRIDFSKTQSKMICIDEEICLNVNDLYEVFDGGPLGDIRRFLSSPHSRESVDLGTGKPYLIMGKSYQYVLGERTWIEYWPTAAGCQTDQHRLTCLGLEEIVQQHLRFGCQL
ncbi:hypothetical protein F2P81_024066 [Scophthalmus maximus]|uniref:NTR domain-containing protein n=1 Tax=Scophthalmus maximus TaxID=52904 RepID=A0A6A4RLS0_SCOMX|nr:hypothetical protein F2P81_024066 [Scophthalmus maximus]